MAPGKTATGGKGCREKMPAVENGYGKKTAKGVFNMAPGKTATGGKGCRKKTATVKNGYGKKTAKPNLT